MNKNKVLAIILARKNSTRLKNKLSLKIGNKNILDFFYRRLSKCKNIDKIVMAVPKSDKIYFAKIANDIPVPIHYGPEKNVLKRFHDVSSIYNYKYIVRANADCPLIDTNLIDKKINIFKKNNYDLYSPFFKNIYPFGISLCIFRFSTIEKIFLSAYDNKYKEHIENFCFDNPSKFKIYTDKNSSYPNPNLRLTLDTIEDYNRIISINKFIERSKDKNLARLLSNLKN